MAVATVTSYWLSATNSLFSGKIQGILRKCATCPQFSLEKSTQIQRVRSNFPTANNREFSSGSREWIEHNREISPIRPSQSLCGSLMELPSCRQPYTPKNPPESAATISRLNINSFCGDGPMGARTIVREYADTPRTHQTTLGSFSCAIRSRINKSLRGRRLPTKCPRIRCRTRSTPQPTSVRAHIFPLRQSLADRGTGSIDPAPGAKINRMS